MIYVQSRGNLTLEDGTSLVANLLCGQLAGVVSKAHLISVVTLLSQNAPENGKKTDSSKKGAAKINNMHIQRDFLYWITVNSL